jgi:hypothetical protein
VILVRTGRIFSSFLAQDLKRKRIIIILVILLIIAAFI